jgi:hypothetical protein
VIRLADLKARFALGLGFDAVVPTNFLFTNLAALKRSSKQVAPTPGRRAELCR